jgi:16S rRNA (guanine966-N2)-methyltransferase
LTLREELRTIAVMVARSNQVRIIAGRWRGRRLAFPDIEGLRPTSDRMRETLFNWLAPVLPGARCLDLFAGSGALGFEAASRGASRVVMNDRNAQVVSALQASRAQLAAEQVEVLSGDVRRCLTRAGGPFDLVFLDPPFAQPGLLQEAVMLLNQAGRLNPGAYIYVELPANRPADGIPASWELHRQKQAGAVSYRLYRYAGVNPEAVNP